MHNFLWTQIVLILIGIGVSYYYLGSFGAISAAYGGGIALFSSLVLSRRVTRVVKAVEDDIGKTKGSQRVMTSLYVGVVQRYVFVLLGLGIGLALLKFNAEPLLAVFGVAQLAFFIMPWLTDE